MKYLLILLLPFSAIAQETKVKTTETDSLPFRNISEVPDSYSASTVVVRMIDGLGFRYYWGTEGLRKKDLEYRPDESARSSTETLEHIYELSQMILNTCLQRPNERAHEEVELSFTEIRKKTLLSLKMARDTLLANKDELEDLPIVFESKDGSSEFPFWNLINGPIGDAIWHVGQLVSFRRASGNPIPSGISFFQGVKREE